MFYHNEQVLLKIQDELKAKCAELHAVEESKRKLMNEKTSLEERISRVERKKSDEARIILIFKNDLDNCLCYYHLRIVLIIPMQMVMIERNFEQERRALKLRISELEKKLDEATQNLVLAQSTIASKDIELSTLQNNLRELEELREMKEVKI